MGDQADVVAIDGAWRPPEFPRMPIVSVLTSSFISSPGLIGPVVDWKVSPLSPLSNTIPAQLPQGAAIAATAGEHCPTNQVLRTSSACGESRNQPPCEDCWFFFELSCARHYNSGSHWTVLELSLLDNSIKKRISTEKEAQRGTLAVQKP